MLKGKHEPDTTIKHILSEHLKEGNPALIHPLGGKVTMLLPTKWVLLQTYMPNTKEMWFSQYNRARRSYWDFTL